DFPTLAVDALVDPLRFTLEVGDHEAGVEFRFAAIEPNHLGLADDATFALPGSSGIVEVGIDVLGLARGVTQDASDDQVEIDLALQDLVLGHRDDVLDADDIEELEQLGCGEAAIEAHPDASLREALLQPADDALEQRERTGMGG